jgi:hypothetical protein
VGLYAQRLTRITTLTNDKITTEGTETRLWFGSSHLLAESAHHPSVSDSPQSESTPGNYADQP